MKLVPGEVATDVVDVTGLSLEEIRNSDDPAFVQSVALLGRRAPCSQTGLLQNDLLIKD